jgi:hypothetical protein
MYAARSYNFKVDEHGSFRIPIDYEGRYLISVFDEGRYLGSKAITLPSSSPIEIDLSALVP